MNIPLGSGPADEEEGKGEEEAGGNGPDIEEVPDAAANANTFLEEHPAAKIVVVIDTHCLENGAFVYEGHSSPTYEACELKAVSSFMSRVHVKFSRTVTDPQGLYSKEYPSLPFKLAEEPCAQSPEHHPQYCLWLHRLCRDVATHIAGVVSLHIRPLMLSSPTHTLRGTVQMPWSP